MNETQHSSANQSGAGWGAVGRRIGQWLLALMLLPISLLGASAPADEEALKKLLELPQLQFTVGFNIHSRKGIQLLQSPPDLAVEIAAVTARLKDDSKDALLQERLGNLYDELEDGLRSSNATVCAVALWRERLEKQPENPEVLWHLGECLSRVGQDTEAEVRLRQAVRAGPKDWQAWSAFARFLSERAMSTLIKHLPKGLAFERALYQLPSFKPTADQIEQTQSLLKESEAGLGKTVALAPAEPQAYLSRTKGRGLNDMTRVVLRVANGEKFDPMMWSSALVSEGNLEDLRRAAELSPSDPKIIITTAMAACFQASLRRGTNSMQETFQRGLVLATLPEGEQSALRADLCRLEQLSQNPNPTNAAQAEEALGTIQMAFFKEGGTTVEGHLRRAISLTPQRDGAWDPLMAFLAERERYADLVAAAEARVKVAATVRNYVALAKSLRALGRNDRALNAFQMARKLDPKSRMACHGEAVIRILLSNNREDLVQAMEPFRILSDMMNDQVPPSERMAIAINYSIYQALMGETEEALKRLRDIRKAAPDNETALAAEKMIKQMQTN
ncbi:MAG: tetratricopeptide repeat protein [Verrucomicrobiota bacterium]